MNLLEMLSKCEDEKTVAFPMKLSGTSNASKGKYAASVSIAFPRNVVNKSLNDLDDWNIFIVAIDKNEYNKILDADENK